LAETDAAVSVAFDEVPSVGSAVSVKGEVPIAASESGKKLVIVRLVSTTD
jgi:hypothetical protein